MDKLANQQGVTYISIAQLLTGKSVYPPKWRLLNDVMSQSELTIFALLIQFDRFYFPI